MPPAACTEKEATRFQAKGLAGAFEVDDDLTLEYIESLILLRVSVRRRSGARREHRFPQREGTARFGGGRFVDMGCPQDIERGTGTRGPNERASCRDFGIHDDLQHVIMMRPI